MKKCSINQKKNLCVSCSDGVKNRKSQALGANEIFGEVQSVSEAKSLYISLAMNRFRYLSWFWGGLPKSFRN